MNLTDYFAREAEEFLRTTPPTGEESGWIDLCELKLSGANILIVDTQFIPSEKEGLLVKLGPGPYLVQGKVLNYGGDRRVSGLRVFRTGTIPVMGEKIGETWTDTARTGICDFEAFSKAWGNDDDAAYGIIEPFLDKGDNVGVAVLDESGGAIMPFVHSGFGDGTFPVLELLEDGKRMGFEIEFIADGTKYPFGATPFEKRSRINEIERRAALGDAEAQYQAGRMYQAGKEVEKDLNKAAVWFDKAAQNGNGEAALALGIMYRTGKGVAQDFSRAKSLYEFAVSKGSVSALNELGVMYRHGQGVPEDHAKAAEYYRQAAEKGFGNAQYNLGVHCSKGWGVSQNYEEAAKWYRLAADQGNLNAIFNLGNYYLDGRGVPKDEKEAVKYYSAGAANGDPKCANNLGHCFETGSGVEKDLKKAFVWYALAAGKEVATAQKSLGVLQKRGEGGVKKNMESALKWLRKAAANGNAEAYYELALIYETGEGVSASNVEAYRLYQKAVDGGFDNAAEGLKRMAVTLTDEERLSIKERTQV